MKPWWASWLWGCDVQIFHKYFTLSKASITQWDWKVKVHGNLEVPLGCRNQKALQLRKLLSFYEECISGREVDVSPLIQDKVKMFCLQEPAGLQEITHWHRRSLTLHLTLYSLSFIAFSHFNVQLDVQHFIINPQLSCSFSKIRLITVNKPLEYSGLRKMWSKFEQKHRILSTALPCVFIMFSRYYSEYNNDT